MAAYAYSNAQENRFWLQTIGDNARLIRSRLIPNGKDKEEQMAVELGNRFDRLYDRSLHQLSAEQLAGVNRDAYSATRDIRIYTIDILRNHLTQGFFIFLKPEYLNHMISMADEYLYILGAYINNRQPEYNPIIQDIFWLPIFIANSRLIADSVGNFQERIRQRAAAFTNSFTGLMEFSFELQGIFRIGVTDFPIAKQHQLDVLIELESFAQLIVELLEMARQNMLPGTLTVLNLDHIYRNLCYYTTQLSVLANKSRPACDAGSPRRTSL